MNDPHRTRWPLGMSLRSHIATFPAYPFARRNTIDHAFFDMSPMELITMPEPQRRRQVSYILGLGPKSERILWQIISDIQDKHQTMVPARV